MMEKRKFNASGGVVWLQQSWLLIRTEPLRLLLLGLLLQLLAGLSQVGILGILFVLFIPVLTAGMLEGFQRVASGERPGPQVLFSAFGRGGRLGALVLLGAISIGVAILAVGLVLAGSLSNVDPDLLVRIQAGDQQAVAELDPLILQKAFIAMILGLFLSTALSYFAVPLMWFKGLSLGSALVTGIAALFRHWKPFLVLGLLLGLIAVPLGMLAAMAMIQQMSGEQPNAIVTLLMMFLMVGYQLLVFGTQYASFSAVFGESVPPEETDTPPEDQLVA